MTKRVPLLVFITLIFSIFYSFAQSNLTENTLMLDHPDNMPEATIEDVSWLTGRWLGEGFGGLLEENWNPPLGGSMVATFRLVNGEQTQFYEICLIEQEGNSLVYKVKHFNPGLKGWEEKDESIRFPLVKIEPNTIYFQGLTLKRDGNKCTHYLAMKQQDGSRTENALSYVRSSANATLKSNEILDEWKFMGNKIPLLLLGSYHMSNPGADQFNLESDDVYSEKRQREIAELVDRLAAFQPTKIAIEAPFGDTITMNRFKSYLAGEHTLRRSEEEQIGFRLAKKLGHQTIFPIDVRFNLNMSALEKVVSAAPQEHGPRMAELDKLGTAAISTMGEWLKNGTVSDMLYEMNRPQFLDMAYQLYLRIFLPTVEGNDYAGADLVADWYHRNLRIMSNLHQIDCKEGDKVLIVYGQGHIPLFERIAKDSPYFDVVDVLQYLK